MGYGVNEDVHTGWITYYFFEEDKKAGTCEFTVMDYPGWYHGKDEIESKPTCQEYDELFYDDMWSRFKDGDQLKFRIT